MFNYHIGLLLNKDEQRISKLRIYYGCNMKSDKLTPDYNTTFESGSINIVLLLILKLLGNLIYDLLLLLIG